MNWTRSGPTSWTTETAIGPARIHKTWPAVRSERVGYKAVIRLDCTPGEFWVYQTKTVKMAKEWVRRKAHETKGEAS